MEHKFLYIKKGRKKVRSRRFDFEAMCLIDDNRDMDCGVVKKSLNSLFYMFEGTDITDEDIKKLKHEELTVLCAKLFLWYREILMTAAENAKVKGEGNGNTKLRTLYQKLFAAFGTLPGNVAIQPPELILFALSSEDEKKQDVSEMSAEVKMLYGL
jgi:hypothetical protein